MIEGLKPYPEYKESGLTWLDRIPTGWDEQRSKYLFREVDRRSTTGEEMRLSMSQRHGLIPSADVEEKRLVSETNIGGKICEPGELVLNRLKAHLGVFALSSKRGLVSPDYTVFRPIGTITGRYFCTLYRSPYCGQELRRTAKGIVEGFWRLYTDQFYDIRVPVPALNEQAAIVRFLDHANHKIDGFIRAKRKLIGLLNEQKQAITHRAVTRGLHLDVSLKPSGIPWLGDIPQHWEVRRLKFLAHIKTGGRDTVDRIDDGPYPFYVRSQTVERIDTFSFDGEAVLTAGDGAGVGKVFHYVNGKFEYHQRVYKFSNFQQIRGKFFFHYFRSSLRFEALDASAKSTVDSLRLPLLQNFPTVLPPTAEQDEIVKWIEAECFPIDTAIARTEREIALMQEYRTRLTADIVTGKLDVREAAAKLPDLPAAGAAEPMNNELLEEELETEEVV